MTDHDTDGEERTTDQGRTTTDQRTLQKRMRRALRDVRREGWKAALLYAVVDAAVAFLAVDLAVTVLAPPSVPAQVAVPATVTSLVAPLQGATLPVAALVGIAVAVPAFALETWLRVRRPLVERFEGANPAVAEALRTARDAVDDGADSRMAARLYGDVLDRLGETSGVALVDLRRLAGTVVVAGLLGAVTLQASAAGIALLDGGGAGPASPGAGGSPDRPYTGLEDGDSVLGDREDVTAGDENLTARIESTGGDDPIDQPGQFPSADPGGGGSGEVGSQHAGFADPEQVDDAELIREYNLRLREEEDDT
ncbi:MAG: hypothetical protein ABEJ74_00920 [Haloferacaceae archaeon]